VQDVRQASLVVAQAQKLKTAFEASIEEGCRLYHDNLLLSVKVCIRRQVER
jgi:hypothetical protein